MKDAICARRRRRLERLIYSSDRWCLHLGAMKKRSSIVGLGAFCLWLFSLAAAFAQVSLPEDVAITPPADDVLRDAAQFAGAWAGDAWDGVIPAVLVVEQVSADGIANVLYAWGDTPSRHIEHGWKRLSGKIANGELTVTLPTGDVAEFAMASDGKLFGIAQQHSNGWRYYLRLVRISASDTAGIIAAAATPQPPIWQEIRIPENSQVGATAGETLTLRATLYRTDLSGRRPLVVINHGCTDCGAHLTRTPFFQRYEEQARFFLALGDNVIVPMRKGVGTSDGPMLESDDVPPNIGVDSAVEDLKAVVDYMQAQSYVDSTKIVLAGISRGGMLSVVYAGRFPGSIADVINFSGGWWTEYYGGNTNARLFAAAGRATNLPMLWLYAENDSKFPPSAIEHYFYAFHEAGGEGRLVEANGIVGDGHCLFSWLDKWREPASEYLSKMGRADADGLVDHSAQ
jgi:dienelactone hydrolase